MLRVLRVLRVTFLLASLAFLAFALYFFVSSVATDPRVRASLGRRFNPFEPSEEDKRAEHKQDELAYAARLRRDAYARIAEADYANAARRLDDASAYDPAGERESAEVIAARKEIADNRTPQPAQEGRPTP